MVRGSVVSGAGRTVATMSDIQCPARLFLGAPVGEADVEEWRSALRGEGLAAEYDLRGRPVDVPDLVDLADVHRGEAVLLLVDADARALGGALLGTLVASQVDSTGLLRTGVVARAHD